MCLGLVDNLAEFYPEAKWQRCIVHFYRNVWTAVPTGKVKGVAAMLKATHAQEDAQSASTGQNAMSLSAYAWPGFASNNYAPGPLDSNVTLSSFQYVDSTHASFALSVSSGASTGVDQIQANEFSSGAVWPIFIQPPSPPGLPNPPSPSTSCGTPSIASVTPDTWMAGQSYPITIVGSGFTNAAMAAANSNCTANQLTVSVPTGSVTLSNIVIMDSTKITATVQPVQTDPTETATLILWGASSGGVLVARARTGAMAESAAATPMDAGGPPGMQQVAQSTAQVDSCQTPTITSVSPSPWTEGTPEFPTITGSGFITKNSATADCPATQLTVTVPIGTIAVPKMEVISATTIEFMVVPGKDDPTEMATITLENSQKSKPAQVNVVGCNVPTSEISTFLNWDGPTGKWQGTVSGSTNNANTNFSGRRVAESNAGSGSDSCYTKGIPFHVPYGNGPTMGGFFWIVRDNNTYGPDSIGYSSEAVQWYRAHNITPCGFVAHQQMQMECDLPSDSTLHDYASPNTLGSDIDINADTVTSFRASAPVQENY
jgi:hypothetical protein